MNKINLKLSFLILYYIILRILIFRGKLCQVKEMLPLLEPIRKINFRVLIKLKLCPNKNHYKPNFTKPKPTILSCTFLFLFRYHQKMKYHGIIY